MFFLINITYVFDFKLKNRHLLFRSKHDYTQVSRLYGSTTFYNNIDANICYLMYTHPCIRQNA